MVKVFKTLEIRERTVTSGKSWKTNGTSPVTALAQCWEGFQAMAQGVRNASRAWWSADERTNRDSLAPRIYSAE